MQETTQQIIAEDIKNYVPVFHRYDVVLDHGDGAYVWDTNGKKYLDFLGGIAVNVLGHNHPKLVKALTEQVKKLIHVSNLYYTQPQADAAAKLVKLSGLDRAFFGNSGAEANEGAIKVARKWATAQDPEKYQIITAYDSFHGRTLATLTATGQDHYHHGYGPLPEGFDYVPFNDIKALEDKISDKTAAVLIEPIQGEGGVHTPKDGYLQQVRELCDKHHALLIFDEIQTGNGRTGKFFAYQKYGVKPDVVTLAKGLAGGVPIGAFVTTEEVAQAFKPGDHGTTFGGNPLACAGANVVLDTVPQPDFLQHVETVGTYFQEKLQELAKAYPTLIKEVRGEGLIVGAELTSSEHGTDIVNACLQKGAIINCTAGNVLRFLPPLIITEKEVDELMAILTEVCKQFA